MDNTENAFTDTRERHAFVRKVLGIVVIQLSATLSIMTLFVVNNDITSFAKKYYWIGYIFLALYVILWIIIICNEPIRRKRPINIIFLMLFTVLLGIAVGFACAHLADATFIFIAFGITLGFCVLLIVFAFQVKYDFAGRVPLILLLILLIAISICFIVSIWIKRITLTIIIFSALILAFSVLLVSSIQLMLKGKHQYQIDSNDYIYAVMGIYAGVVVIFMNILRLMTELLIC